MEMPTEVWTWLRETPLWLTAKYESKTAEIPWPINEVVLEINEEGTIVGGPLPPGDYSIEENYLLDPDQPRGGQRIRFWVEDASFTIPEDGDPAKPIDLGVIHVKEGLEEDAQPLQAGDLAPDFTITTLEGASIKLSSLRGGYVLLDFWATWCGPCVGETPHLKAVWDRFGERYDFTIIGLSLDDERDLLEAYIRENHIAWPQAFLNGWRGSPLTTEYKVRGIPEIMLIGPDGRVVENNLRGGKIMRVVQEALGG
jgi:thiol-disulfide isomerase/thioredoxin